MRLTRMFLPCLAVGSATTPRRHSASSPACSPPARWRRSRCAGGAGAMPRPERLSQPVPAARCEHGTSRWRARLQGRQLRAEDPRAPATTAPEAVLTANQGR
jgi:hypothetical protein